MDRRTDLKIAFQNSVWRYNLCQNQSPSHRLKGIGQSKEKVKTVCIDILVLYCVYLIPVKKFEPFSCRVRNTRILKVSLHPLHSSFTNTLGGWWLLEFWNSTHKFSLYLLGFHDCKHQKPILVNLEGEIIGAVLGNWKGQRDFDPKLGISLASSQRPASFGHGGFGTPWQYFQDTTQE